MTPYTTRLKHDLIYSDLLNADLITEGKMKCRQVYQISYELLNVFLTWEEIL